MDSFFYHIYCLVQRHKLLSVVSAILFLLCCASIASKIRFEEDIMQIIPQSEKSDLTTKAMEQINFSDKITVLIEKTPGVPFADASSLAQALVDTLSLDTTYISEITGTIGSDELKATYDFVFQNLPLFLDSRGYDSIAYKINPAFIKEKVKSNYQALISPSSFITADFIQSDPLGLTFLGLEKLQQMNLGTNFIVNDGFISTKDSAAILLFLTPTYKGTETAYNKILSDGLYGIAGELNAKFTGKASVSYYGSALIAVANADQIKNDITKTILISMSILMVILILFYRKLYVPLLVFVPTVFAGAFAMACLYIYKPVISAISISIAAVLIGITIDYALHVLTHYKKSHDIKTLYKELTKPLMMSGATTAVAFLCLLFVHSEALVDLGIFASIAVFSSSIFTLLIVPHLYHPKAELTHNSWIDRVAAFPFERSKVLIGLCLVLIVVSIFSSTKVHFNNNIADLNFVPPGLAKVERKLDILTNTSAKSLYVVATGNTLDTALARNAEIATLLKVAQDKNAVLEYSNIDQLLQSTKEQDQKIAQWNSFWQYHDATAVQIRIQQEGLEYGFETDAHQAFYDLLVKDFHPLTYNDLKDVENLGMKDFVSVRDKFFTVSTLVKLEEEHRSAVVRVLERIDGVVVIDRKQLNETFLGKLRDDFNALIGYSFVAVLLILWAFFKRVELVLLAAIPIGLTGLVTAGLMGLFGLEFNIFSAIVCTLVFGHGVDFSIFMTTALQKQYSTGKDELQIYRTSILLAVLTTVLAIGALIFAKHPALISISTVSLIGVFSAVIITFVFYPILFRFFISDRAKKGKSPFTIKILVCSLLLFTYYGLGCIFTSFFGRFILPLLPMKPEKRDLIFQRLISRFMKSVLYYHPLTENKTWNPYGETFKKPAVVIGNHSSFLDTLTMGMLVPKMLFLVNDWVWKSPVFGKAVQALGFYPVSKGLAQGMNFLRQKVANGYSIVVFPEGTRSVDNDVKRFHKGAFYLSESLHLDIVPVYVHGNGDVLPKGDFIIFGGQLNPVIGQRIKADDVKYGVTYTERAKTISMDFRTNYDQWRFQLEDENYFIKKIKLAYLYKDEEIIQQVEESLRSSKGAFHQLNSYLGKKRRIAHLSDSYGELDYLLSLQEARRKVVGIIQDEQKREVAASIYWQKHRQVHFSATLEPADVLLISKRLTIEDYKLVNFDKFNLIINSNLANDFSFLDLETYQREDLGNQISIYKKSHAAG